MSLRRAVHQQAARILPVLFLSLVTAGLFGARDATRVDLAGDPLPEGAISRLGTGRLRQASAVNAMAFAPDGKALVTGSYSNKLHFWDLASGKQLREWTITPYATYGLQYSQDGKILVVAGGDGTIRLLDASTGAERRSFQDPMRRYGNLHGLLSPDGKTLLMIHRYDRQMLIWDVESGTLKHRITGISAYHQPPLAFTSTSKQFVTLWTDSRLHLVDVATGKSVRTLEPALPALPANSYSSRVAMLALTPDDKQVIYRPTNERAFLMVDLETAKQTRRIDLSTGGYYASTGFMSLTPNGRFLFESGGDQAVRVWGLASGKVLRQLQTPSGLSVASAAFSRDGKYAATASGGAIFVWDVGTGRQLHDNPGHGSAPTRLLFLPGGKQLLSAGSSSLRVWDVATGKQDNQSRTWVAGSAMSNLANTPDGKAIRWVASDRAVYQWSPGSQAEPVRLTHPRTAMFYSSQSVSPDGKTLAAINASDRKLKLIDLTGTQPERELLIVANGYSNNLVFSLDGRRLAVAQSDRSLTIIDVASGVEIRKLVPDMATTPGAYYTPVQMQFSRDGRSFLVHDTELRIVETLTGGERLRFPRDPSGSHMMMAWSDDGRLVARALADGAVVVYETQQGREVLRRNGGQGGVSGMAFSADGRRLAVSGANTTILVWDVPEVGKVERVAGLTDDAAWADLGEIDTARSYRAMLHLSASPAETIRLLKERLKPRPPVDARRVSRLIDDLDNDSYAIREKASLELAEIGYPARAALEKAVGSASVEVKRRAEDLLRKLSGSALSPDRLKDHRAIEVLEMVGTPAARKALEQLLEARLEPTLEQAIRGTLERLAVPAT